MILRRKLYLGALLGAILFLMIAAHTIQKASVVPNIDLSTHHHDFKNCSCPSCIADKGVSGWFDQRYDHKQQPYLTGRDDDIDPLSLKWWLSLQASDGVKKGVFQKMFEIIPPPHKNEMPQQGQCRRCAVVGNSGNLLKSKYGALIDSHPFVIRMNRAVTVGFEEYVGNRTTHHFMYPESAIDLRPGVHLVLLPFKLKDIQWLSSALSTGEIKMTYMRVKSRVKADKDKVMVINPAFFKYTHDKWTERHGRYPSTGIVAIMFALHQCDEVSVFGYGADKQGSWHHYWEYNKYAAAFRKTGVHNADFETSIIQRLHKEGKIKLYM
ncbi:ST3 beta-galactoside alpha-2,3-sialyltransferase 8 [Carassius auratus]|uniref:CMP-N-acetylneuraminate-beta-galactosamide-alpha-2,3-sialyltransferase 2 n=1 Tax=Carassius auratus TaxID=7957 RepID=A0A6P6QDN8_CARAU|nr:CMP-N-acetylneuraminate-beta-galactosamide-alpha-2,3-sialyltransferase 2-like [Carassius auratus]XP_026131391.1 CMP-N-acetylneuraminate-beta-galactosamide-alpha-2,3-sialyltransferase 2-like [Carassius auratus]XP_026131392.1 CMP-N-acetylneuraminate-beta-galactosamide-alpha-2,3-sialyltransferase 2-like [Carassius auratus]XP_026131393.1 CMP-N-acetylneuraminate-beta-galactosamide-alpha-2,3-sialyltransferase 2-like [Carassius auratus]